MPVFSLEPSEVFEIDANFEAEELKIREMDSKFPETAGAEPKSVADYLKLLAPNLAHTTALGFSSTPSSMSEVTVQAEIAVVTTAEQQEEAATQIIAALKTAPMGKEKEAAGEAVSQNAQQVALSLAMDTTTTLD